MSVVATDLPCLACGYNLRTQLLTGVCPECTHPVAESMAGDQLFRADPRWLARIQRGLLIESVASLLIITYGLCQAFDLNRHQSRILGILLAAALGGFAIGLLTAGWLLS